VVASLMTEHCAALWWWIGLWETRTHRIFFQYLYIVYLEKST
jgi:hypothetical protein